MNALDLLRSDHPRISQLLQQLKNELDPATRQAGAGTLDDLSRAVRNHLKMLSDCLYPELEKYAETSALISAESQTTARINGLIAELEHNQPLAQGWRKRIQELSEAWKTHVQQSEMRLFPEAAKLLDATKLQELQYEMDSIRTHQSGFDSAIYPASRLGPKK